MKLSVLHCISGIQKTTQIKHKVQTCIIKDYGMEKNKQKFDIAMPSDYYSWMLSYQWNLPL